MLKALVVESPQTMLSPQTSDEPLSNTCVPHTSDCPQVDESPQTSELASSVVFFVEASNFTLGESGVVEGTEIRSTLFSAAFTSR